MSGIAMMDHKENPCETESKSVVPFQRLKSRLLLPESTQISLRSATGAARPRP